MTIKGLDAAITSAIERARRTKQAICIVDIGNNEYVLWREVTLDSLPLLYKDYAVVKTIRIKLDDTRR